MSARVRQWVARRNMPVIVVFHEFTKPPDGDFVFVQSKGGKCGVMLGQLIAGTTWIVVAAGGLLAAPHLECSGRGCNVRTAAFALALRRDAFTVSVRNGCLSAARGPVGTRTRLPTAAGSEYAKAHDHMPWAQPTPNVSHHRVELCTPRLECANPQLD